MHRLNAGGQKNPFSWNSVAELRWAARSSKLRPNDAT